MCIKINESFELAFVVFKCIKFHNFAMVSSKDFIRTEIRNKLPFSLLIYHQMFCYFLFYMTTATSGRGIY